LATTNFKDDREVANVPTRKPIDNTEQGTAP